MFGGDVPYLLREKRTIVPNGNGNDERYAPVRECYLHRIMDGEIMGKADMACWFYLEGGVSNGLCSVCTTISTQEAEGKLKHSVPKHPC